MSKPTQNIIQLCKPIVNSKRYVTSDNGFLSIEVIKELKKISLNYVGKLKANKIEIPPGFRTNKKKTAGSSIYGFEPDLTLVSFVPKPRRTEILSSSMHKSKYREKSNNKPEIISCYNSTKSGVENWEKIIATYSPNRRSGRWPLT